jgi:MinD-like ATPase involved in chromosome partitioning or flagellar assembly
MSASVGPELALAASARDWPERVHRFLLDHGGGRVRARVMGPDQALADDFELILIDDVCSFLNQRLVRSLREHGKEIVGVYSPGDGPDAKRYLLECGISDVIEADASAAEFLAVVAATLRHRAPVGSSQARGVDRHVLTIGVTGASGGVGVTEVALGVAHSLSADLETLLVDLNLRNPGVAQRLDLPLHPNLLTAVDLAHHSTSRLKEAVIGRSGLSVIGGLARFDRDPPLPTAEIRGLLIELSRLEFEVHVVDLGESSAEQTAVVEPDILIVVGAANPVGITRLVRKARDLDGPSGVPDLLAVINGAPKKSHRSIEIRSEWLTALPGIPMVLIPNDTRVERAAWDGTVASRGGFAKSIRSIAELVMETLE